MNLEEHYLIIYLKIIRSLCAPYTPGFALSGVSEEVESMRCPFAFCVTRSPTAAFGWDLHCSPGTEATKEKNQGHLGAFEDTLSICSRLCLMCTYKLPCREGLKIFVKWILS